MASVEVRNPSVIHIVILFFVGEFDCLSFHIFVGEMFLSFWVIRDFGYFW